MCISIGKQLRTTIQFLLPYGFPVFSHVFPMFPHFEHLRTMVLPAPHLSSCERSRLAAGITPSWRFQRSPWEPWESWEASVNRGTCGGNRYPEPSRCDVFFVRKWDRLGFNQQMVGVALRIGSFTSPTEGLTTTSEGATNNPQQMLHINSNL